MPKRIFLTLIVALSLSAAIVGPGSAQPNKIHKLYKPPFAAPEFDSKLLIGGLAVTAGSVALLIERRRRHRSDDASNAS
jgi:hypothetical protein